MTIFIFTISERFFIFDIFFAPGRPERSFAARRCACFIFIYLWAVQILGLHYDALQLSG